MDKRIEVTITLGDRRITLEGPEGFVREEVERLAGAQTQIPVPTAPVDKSRSERDFVATKKPEGHAEIVATLAFFLREHDLVEFKADDMRRAYIRANVRPPKVIDQALRDAKNKYDFIEPGATKGTYRLTAHGERTVMFDLPRKAIRG